MILTDALGNAHTPVDTTPRIASLVPSITDLLFSLDLGDQLVARTGFCIHPREAVRNVPKVGGHQDRQAGQAARTGAHARHRQH